MVDDDLKQLLERMQQENAAAREENAAAHEETRRLFEMTAERLRTEIQRVGENVIMVDEKLDRTADNIREEMRSGFANTQAMIKFSHDELHRRVSVLEETQRTVGQTLTELQARVERLEGSTH